IFLLNPFPAINEFRELSLLAAWGSMLVISIYGVLLSTIVIKLFSEKLPCIPSDAYKEHPFIATIVFYSLGIFFIFAFIECFMPLFINIISIVLNLILP
ncbi:hypothetical protein DON81_22585, partial [Salmonella enterica]|nr:hypothetical protein [Salmonella enterica]